MGPSSRSRILRALALSDIEKDILITLVTDAELEKVLRAAMAAPSASNERPWRFVVVREPDALARLARTTPFAGVVRRAPAAVVVCADRAEAKLAETRKKLGDLEKDLKAARGRLETEKRVYVVQKGELELAQDRYADLHRRHDALRKEHDELIDAVRQAAKEEAHRAEPGTPPGEPPA